MVKLRLRRAAALSAFLLPLMAFAAPTINVVKSTIKVKPGFVPATAASAAVSAAKNEFEAFQIVVDADSGGLASVSVTKPVLTLTTSSSVTIPSSEIQIFREGLVSLTQASNLEGGTGLYPDPLIPSTGAAPALQVVSSTDIREVISTETRNAFPWTVPANGRLIVWVDIHVPENATPGVYQGTLSINSTSISGGSQNVPVTLTVHDFALPSKSSLPSFFKFSSDSACRKHYATSSSTPAYCDSNDHLHKVSALYSRFLLQHRLSMQLPDSPNSFTNWSTVYNDYLDAYGPMLTGTETLPGYQDLKQLKTAKHTSVNYPWHKGTDSPATRGIKLAKWWEFAGNNSMQSKTFHYTADEPGNIDPWSQIPTYAAEVHSISTSFRTLCTTTLAELQKPEHNYKDHINIIVVLNQFMDAKTASSSGTPDYHGNQRDTYDTFLASSPDNALWGYQSCAAHGCVGGETTKETNWPNVMIDATGLQNRAEPWMQYIYKQKGMLYFDTVEAFNTISSGSSAFSNANLWRYTGNGDGTLVYPGTPADISGSTHIPVASYRLKMIREGMEDYEYLLLCANKNETTAMNIARALFAMSGTTSTGRETGSMYSANSYPSPTPVTDADRLENARAQLVACIAPPPAPPSWTEVGTTGFDGYAPVMRLDSTGKPVVAWQAVYGNDLFVTVKRWTGTAWQMVGTPRTMNSGSSSVNPMLALDSSDNPVVAWSEWNPTAQSSDIYVQRWTGTAWQSLGGGLSAIPGANSNAYPSGLELDSSGDPVIAFVELDGSVYGGHVWYWDSALAQWQSIGGTLSSVSGTTSVGLTGLQLDSSGNPTVAWNAADNTTGAAAHVYVQRWNGTSWQYLGGAMSANNSNPRATAITLRMNSLGSTFIAFADLNPSQSGFDIYVKQWTGTAWVDVGGALEGVTGFNTHANGPALTLDGSGKPLVAWSEATGPTSNYKIFARRWNGSAWVAIADNIAATSGSATQYNVRPSLGLTSTGTMYLAWPEYVSSVWKTYVYRSNP